MRSLTILDFVCIGAVLLISGGIGVYYAIKSKKDKSDNTDEYMSGGRRMPLLPTALSLMASFISGVGMLSIPAEIYTGGVAFAWAAVGASVGILFCTVFVIPVLFRVKSMSMYAYVQDRFDSKWLRLYSSTIFQLSTLMYMAVVLYAPSVALAALSDLPIWIWILSVGVVCTIYTTIGGLKAVVWTDTFQALIMYAGLLALVIKGTMAVGGFGSVFRLANQGGRLANAFNMDPDPFQYMSFWTAFMGGGVFTWVSVFGTSQVAMQRYRSLPSVGRAQAIAFINIPAMLIIMGLVYYLGVIMFAYYAECDPLKSNQIRSRDQLVILYTLDVLGGIYGLPGLFLACVFSATLSTVSSGINSLSAAALEDYVRLCFKPNIDEKSALRFSKFIGLVYGLLAMILAFAAEPLGGILIALNTVSGSLNGPNVGLILAGILCPWANKIGGAVGVVAATALNLWIFVGSQVRQIRYAPLPTSIQSCAETGIGNFSYLSDEPTPIAEPLTGLNKFYGLSFVMYVCLGTVISFLLCSLVSALTGGSDVRKKRPDLLFWTRYVDDEKCPSDKNENEKEKPLSCLSYVGDKDENGYEKTAKIYPIADVSAIFRNDKKGVTRIPGLVTRV